MSGSFPVKDTLFYKFFSAEKEEIMRHKWIESEKKGSDIGYDKALLNWIINHESDWRNNNKIFFSGLF
jgi:hypothetical protein